MEDDRNFIERAQSLAQIYTGKDLSPEEMAASFVKLSPEDQVTAIDRLNRDLASGASDDFPHLRGKIGTAREVAKHHAYERAVRAAFAMCRKVDR